MSEVYNDKVVNIFQHKTEKESLFNITQAEADIAKYETAVLKSVDQFHTFSIQQKQELYSSLAAFNVEILKQLLERKRND
jgi:hypothetical protein